MKGEGFKRIALTLLSEVVLPLCCYGALRVIGVAEAWSLVAAGGVSVVTGIVEWSQTRRIGLLGVVILIGFLASATVAFVTRDPVAVFMVDPANNLVVAMLVIFLMRTRRPFVARVRRDLAADPQNFDSRWVANAWFRRQHRRASWVWAAGLTLLAVLSTAAVVLLSFDAAVASSRVIGAAIFVALIAGSEVLVRRQPEESYE